jgi:Mn-dependent DtxR family transcriptional regulator
MGDQTISESIEEYLEVIYRLSFKNPGGWVKNKEISERLRVKAPSVTNMLEKLSNASLIDWTPRSGIRLTDLGRQKAKDIVTNHIIIELFLDRVLKITDPQAANRLACDLEHHLTPGMKESMNMLLGFPEIKNIDNLFLEDLPPQQIQTNRVYYQHEIHAIEQELLSKITCDQDQEIVKQVFEKFLKKD